MDPGADDVEHKHKHESDKPQHEEVRIGPQTEGFENLGMGADRLTDHAQATGK